LDRPNRDKAFAARQTAEADSADGGILIRRNPETAAQALVESLRYFQAAAPVRVPALHLLLARARMAQGLDESAEAELLAESR